MSILKVKFKLNGLELELEGSEEVVREELSSFKEYLTGSLINKIGIANTPTNVNLPTTIQNAEILNADYPQLKEIVIKDLPKTEVEWILIYSFYTSNFGEEPFKEVDIRNMYEKSNRKNVSRMKNFSVNFNKVVSNGYIKVLNQEEYITVKKGIDLTKEILFGKNQSTESVIEPNESKPVKKAKKGKGKISSTSNSLSLVHDLNLNPKSEKSLKEYFNGFLSKSFFERNLLFVYYLQKILKIQGIGQNHIYTCYKGVGEKVPGNLYQSLVDTKNIKGWIDSKDINNLIVTIAGENFVEHDFPKSA